MAHSSVSIDQEQIARFIKEVRSAEEKMADAARTANVISDEHRGRWGTEPGPQIFHELFVREMASIRDEYQKLQADFNEFAHLVHEATTRTLDREADAELALKIQRVTVEMDAPKSAPTAGADAERSPGHTGVQER